MNIRRDVNPENDKKLDEMLDAKFGKQGKTIITGETLRKIAKQSIEKQITMRQAKEIHSGIRAQWRRPKVKMTKQAPMSIPRPHMPRPPGDMPIRPRGVKIRTAGFGERARQEGRAIRGLGERVRQSGAGRRVEGAARRAAGRIAGTAQGAAGRIAGVAGRAAQRAAGRLRGAGGARGIARNIKERASRQLRTLQSKTRAAREGWRQGGKVTKAEQMSSIIKRLQGIIKAEMRKQGYSRRAKQLAGHVDAISHTIATKYPRSKGISPAKIRIARQVARAKEDLPRRFPKQKTHREAQRLLTHAYTGKRPKN